MTAHKILRTAGVIVALASLSFLALDGLSGTAEAQIIWSSAANISGDSDVYTAGSSVFAYDWNGADGNATLNGVAFSGEYGSASGITLSGGQWYGGSNNPMSAASGLDSTYQAVLGGVVFGCTGGTLQGLTAGHDYAVQVWCNDSRNYWGPTAASAFSSAGGNSVALLYDVSGAPAQTAGGAGQYAIGDFVAGGASQAFTIMQPGAEYLTALQLRDVTNIGYWNGINGSAWDVNTTANFCLNGYANALNNGTFSQASSARNAVVFGDYYYSNGGTTAVTQTNLNVAAGGVQTGAVFFRNSALNYTLTSADSAGITGATAVTVQGPGMVTFAGPNSYSGSTIISGGTLQASSAAALPGYNAAGYVTVNAGGALLLSAGGPGWAGAEIASLNTSGFQTGSMLAVDTTGGNTTVSGAIAGNEGLTVQGNNSLTFTTYNSYTGGTTVNGGTLVLTATNGSSVGIIRGNLTINSGATVSADAGVWALGFGAATCVSGIAINGGVLAFSDTSGATNTGGLTAGSVTMTGGTISGFAGWYNAITSAPTLTTNASTATAVISGGFRLRLGSSGNLTFDVAQGSTASGVDLLVSGPIEEEAAGEGVVKSGSGVLSLATFNTYTGGTTVNGGTLALARGSDVGIILGNLTINGGGTVDAKTAWSLGYTAGECVSGITIDGGVLTFSGTAGQGGTSASSITMTGGTISGLTPDWYYGITSTPTLTTNASTATAVISSGFNLRLNSTGSLTINVAAGSTASGVDLLISGPIASQNGAGRRRRHHQDGRGPAEPRQREQLQRRDHVVRRHVELRQRRRAGQRRGNLRRKRDAPGGRGGNACQQCGDQLGRDGHVRHAGQRGDAQRNHQRFGLADQGRRRHADAYRRERLHGRHGRAGRHAQTRRFVACGGRCARTVARRLRARHAYDHRQ